MASQALELFCAEHIDDLNKLVRTFSDYQPVTGVDRPHLMRWLSEFKPQHMELALKFALSVQYYSTHAVNSSLKALHESIDQQIQNSEVPRNSVFYVPVGRIAESGQDIIRRYRNVNQLHSRKKQFVDLIELHTQIFSREKTIVFFFDDFIGTGKQICDYWRDILSQYVPEYLPLYLVVVAAFPDGMSRIEGESPLKVITVNTLTSRHQLLGAANNRFNNAQKNTLRRYCESWGNHPLGFGKLGAMVSFSHGTPNNAPSIIRGSEGQQSNAGLLPGWEDL